MAATSPNPAARLAFRWLLGLACILSPALAMADDSSAALQVSGFATLAVTHNDNATAGAIVANSQKHPAGSGVSGNLDSVLGVQLDWQALRDTSVVLQGVARAGNDMTPELRMGYLRQELGGGLSVRAGRIRSPLYLDSDVAEIGYAYLMSRPPIPLYGIVNNVSSIDGADLQWRHTFGDAAFTLQGYYGRSGYKHRFYNLNPVAAADAELRDIRGLALNLALPSLRVRVSRTWVGSYTLRSDQVSQLNAGLGQLSAGLRAMAANPALPAATAAALNSEAGQIQGFGNPFDNRPIYTSIGFDGNAGNWRILGEWARMDSRSAMVGQYQGWQLTAGYPLGEFTPYASLAHQKRLSPPLDTRALAATGLDPALDGAIAQMKNGLDQAAGFADLSTRSISLGVRYDFRENMALKVQYDRLQTPSTSTPGYFAVPALPMGNRVNLFTVSLDMVF